jgi:hypothetical protein
MDRQAKPAGSVEKTHCRTAAGLDKFVLINHCAMEKLVTSLSGDREAFMASVISESNQPELNRRSVLSAATAAAVSVAAQHSPTQG